VSYSFKVQPTEDIEPDWEGDTYKYVIGTTYTTLEMLIINKRIMGPQWIRVEKKYLADNAHKNV
jgi:hypothetical protein